MDVDFPDFKHNNPFVDQSSSYASILGKHPRDFEYIDPLGRIVRQRTSYVVPEREQNFLYDDNKLDGMAVNGPATREQVYLDALETRNAANAVLKANKPRTVRRVMFEGARIPTYVPGRKSTYSYGSKRNRSYGGYTRRRRFTRRRWHGRGGYFASLAGKAAQGLGNMIPFQNALDLDTSGWGDSVRKWGEGREKALFNKYMGTGAYNKNMVAPNSRLEQEVPEFASGGSCEEGCVSIVHKEYIGDILSSTGFVLQQSLVINPGLPGTFPWLSAIAQNFTMYRFRSLIFTFKSMSGALSSTQALGEVIGSANYNVYDNAFTNKTQMLNEIFSQSKVPSEDALFPIECTPSQTTGTGLLMVRGGSVPTTQDKRFYDLGNFYLASNGQNTANITLGELWVSYAIDLYKPQLDTIGISPSVGAADLFRVNSAAASTPLAGATSVFNSIGSSISGSVLTIPAGSPGTGNFILTYYVVGSATSTLVAPSITLVNATGLNLFASETANSNIAPYGGTDNSTTLILQYSFSISNQDLVTTLTFGTGGTLPASVTYGNLFITQVPLNA